MRGASLTRRVRFAATHRYHRPEWDEARNRAVFGDCASPTPHGHEYACDVTVGGRIDPATGMLVDLGALDRVLDAIIVRPLNGECVNDALGTFANGGLIPTCEELARVFATRLDVAFAAAGLAARVRSVRVAEDDTLSATWTAGE